MRATMAAVPQPAHGNRRQFELVADTRDGVGESPVWLAREKALVWTDITGRRIHRLDARSGSVTSWTVPDAVGSLAPAAGSGFVAATERGFAQLELGDGEAAALIPIASALVDRIALRFNDGRCDRQGRFWASSMAWQPAPDAPQGSLWRLQRGIASPILDGLIIGNGLAWSPDGRTMYLAESHASRPALWTYDFDTADGVPSGRRLFRDFSGTGGRPDGAAVDCDGCLWVAVTDAGQIHRYTPDGAIDLTLDVPVPHPTMPCFGGSDMRTLYLTSLRRPAAPADRHDGGVFAMRVPQQGLADTPYKSRSE